MRRLLFVLLLAVTAHAQHDFQVATIKPSAPDTPRATQIRGSLFVTTGTTLSDLLVYAYNIHPSQIAGAPGWLQTARFDVLADPETETRPTSLEMKAMVARLLTDRFHLVLRHEQRMLPVYAILRTGKTIPFPKDESGPADFPTGGFIPPGTLVVRNGTLANFAAFLQRFTSTEISRPVVDQTGLTGRFDFDLHYTPLSTREPEPNAPPGLFAAILEQLALKLEPTRAPVDVLLIDSVRQPTAD